MIQAEPAVAGELLVPADGLGVRRVLDLDPAADRRVGRVRAPLVLGDDPLQVAEAGRPVEFGALAVDVVGVEDPAAVADQRAQRRLAIDQRPPAQIASVQPEQNADGLQRGRGVLLLKTLQ